MIVQLAPELIDPPLSVKLVDPVVAPVKVALVHVVDPAAPTCVPVGRPSLTPTPVRATVLAAGLVIVMVIVEFVLSATIVGAKALVIVGGISTAKVAVLDVVPVPPLVELTAPDVLEATPEVVSDTLTDTAHVVPGVVIDPPVRLMLLALAVAVKVPPQELVAFGVEATTIPDGKVSLTAMPDSATVLADGLVIVRVKVEVPVVTAMLATLKALVMVGGATTTMVAEDVLPVP